MFSVEGNRTRFSILRADDLSVVGCSNLYYDEVYWVRRGIEAGIRGVTYLKLETEDGRKFVDAQGFACLIPKYE